MRIFKFNIKTSGYKIEFLLNFVPALWRMRFYRNRQFMDGDRMLNIMFLAVQFRIMWYKSRKAFKLKK